MVEPDPVGKTLKQRTKRYTVRFDPTTEVWRILDLWHPALEMLGADSEVNDDNAALTILPGSAFEVLLEEANRLGMLSRYVSEISLGDVTKTNGNTPAKMPTRVQLAKMGIDGIIKLVGMSEVDELSERGDTR